MADPNHSDFPAADTAQPTAAAAAINPNQALDLLGDLEARLGALKTWQAENDKHVEQVNLQALEIAEREQQLAERLVELETLRGELTDDRGRLDADRHDLTAQRDALQSDRQHLDTQRGELQSQREAIAAEQSALEASLDAQVQDQQKLAAAMQSCDDKHQALDQRAEGLDQQLAEVSARTRELDSRQEQLDQQQAALTEQQEKLEAEQGQLQSQWDDVHAARQELTVAQEQLEESRVGLEADRAELEGERAEFAEQRQHLKDRKKELASAQMDLKLRQDSLKAQQESLDRARSELAQQAGDMNNDTLMPGFIPDFDQVAGKSDATDATDALAEQRAALDDRAAELDAQQAELDRQREELTFLQATAPGTAAAAGNNSAELEELEHSLRDREAELEQKETLFRNTLEQSKAKVLRQRQQVQDDEKAVQELAVELEEQQAAINQQQAAFEQRQAELDARAAKLEKLQSDFDVRTDSSDTVMGMGMPTGSMMDEEDADQDVTEREEELGRREEAFRSKKLAFRQQLETDQQELDAERTELDARLVQLEEFAAELKTRQSSIGEREAELTAWAERLEDQAQTLELRSDLAAGGEGEDGEGAEFSLHPLDAGGSDEAEELSQRAAALDRREAELERREQDLAEQEADLLHRIDNSSEPSLGDDDKDQKIRELIDELRETRDRHEKRKAQMVLADQTIKKRRDKVRKYLNILREQSQNIQVAESKVESTSAQHAGLDRERRNLVEVKKFLEASEKAMVQKWATRSTASLVALILIALLGAATFSYFVGKKLAVPIWESSMALSITPTPAPGSAPAPGISSADSSVDNGAVAQPRRSGVAAEAAVEAFNQSLLESAEPGTSNPDTDAANNPVATDATPATPADPAATPAAGQNWLTQFRESIMSAPVMNTTLDQLDQRGIRLFTSPTQLASHFDQHLTVTGDPQRIEFSYTSEQPEHVVGVLDALGKAVVARQMALDRAANRTDTVKMLQSAERNSNPVRDETMLYTGIAFAAITAVALILGLMIRLALGRSKKIMDQADSIPALSTLDKPGTWSPISSGMDQDQAA